MTQIKINLFQAIHGYRETERLNWNDSNSPIIERVKNVAFPKDVNPLKLVHIIDLSEKGYIKPHIDAIRVIYNINLRFI